MFYESWGDLSLLQQGRVDEALPWFEERLAVCTDWVGPEANQTVNAHFGVGQALLELGELQAAEPLLRAIVAMRERRLPPSHWDIASARVELGRCLTALGCYEEAEPLLLESLPPLERRFGPASRQARKAIEAIASLFDASGKPELASVWRARLSQNPSSAAESPVLVSRAATE